MSEIKRSFNIIIALLSILIVVTSMQAVINYYYPKKNPNNPNDPTPNSNTIIVHGNEWHDPDFAEITWVNENFAIVNHLHDDKYALLTHLHDDRYALIEHNHDTQYAQLIHLHDDRYALIVHDHDDRYYTESEIDAIINNYYTKSQVDALFNNYYTKSEIDVWKHYPESAISRDIVFVADGANVAWTNQPSALTEFLGVTRHRLKFNLTYANEVRLIVMVMTAGYATTPAKIRVQYSTDQTTWYYLDGVSAPSVDIGTTGLKVSSWVTITSNAKQDVFLRLVGIDGDGTADPAFGRISIQIK